VGAQTAGRRGTQGISDATFAPGNGAEMTSIAILELVQVSEVDGGYIAPGRPMQNVIVESLDGSVRDEGEAGIGSFQFMGPSGPRLRLRRG